MAKTTKKNKNKKNKKQEEVEEVVEETGGEETKEDELGALEVEEGAEIRCGGIGFDGPIDVFDRNGNYIRTFCEETHGKDYKKKALEFIYDGDPKANADVLGNPVPYENRKRTLRPHDFSIKQADVVDRKGFIRKTFTRERDGIHFIEKAYASFNRKHGLPDTGDPDRSKHKPDRMIPCRVELRR